ncbi:MAG: hypothetical protein ACK4SN_16275, partial [Bellilinea sp.]
AGVIFRGFLAIQNTISGIVTEGIRFNAVMETVNLAIAGVLGATMRVVDERGKELSLIEAYPALLEKAANLQQRILELNIKTLGTGEELQNVFLQVLSSQGKQLANEEELLKVAQIITNVAKIRGQSGQQLIQEARQVLTLETERGQIVLQTLGIEFKRAREMFNQRALIQEIIKEGEAFLELGNQLETSWEALTTSVQTIISLFAAIQFERVFQTLKQFMVGFVDELQKVEKTGGIQKALGLSDEEKQEIGRQFAEVFQGLTRGLAKFAEDIILRAPQIASAVQSFASGFKDFVSFTTSFVTGKVLAILIRDFTNLALAIRAGDTAWKALNATMLLNPWTAVA